MTGTEHGGKVRLGIVGLDHWYIGLDAARAAATHPDVDLVVVAHRDAARAQETAERFGAAEATSDYAGVVSRDDLDVVVTGCRTSDNAALCMEAARHGTHILSVKPIAMTHQEAAHIKDAVEQAGVHFFSWESGYRLSRRYQQLKSWIDEGRIGRPISGLYVLRVGTPTQVWPGVQGQTWWLDPAHAPGGGWVDHAIYTVDLFRWLFGGEVVSAGGTVATLVHKELKPGSEDFGLAALTFGGGQVASLEVTWTGAPGASITATHIVGSDGAIVLDPSAPGRATVSGHFEPFSGWCTVSLPNDDRDPVASMVTALREGASLPAGVADACRNLDVCLTFYEAARAGCTREVSP
jgi:predicted dehydrogenase